MKTVKHFSVVFVDKDGSKMINAMYRIVDVLKRKHIAFTLDDCWFYFNESDSAFNKGRIVALDHLADYECDEVLMEFRNLFLQNEIHDVHIDWIIGDGMYDDNEDTEDGCYISEYMRGMVYCAE
jgi:hypothetical protein